MLCSTCVGTPERTKLVCTPHHEKKAEEDGAEVSSGFWYRKHGNHEFLIFVSGATFIHVLVKPRH